MIDFTLTRTLRTPHSERFLLRRADTDLAAIDIHYLDNGHVDATLIIVEGAGLTEQQIPELLAQIDETILPSVSFAEKTLSFSVVVGRVVGAFVPQGTH